MKIYKTLPDGTQIVEYEDLLAAALADMWNRSGEGWGGTFSDGIWTAGQMREKYAAGSFFNVYVAMKDGEALGYCSFDRYTRDADTAYVHLLNVRPDYHGKKIGKELVLMCVNETITRGMPRVDIHTWPGNTKSVPLYKKCGFLWEDRADTTHLCNFIPTVLSTDLVNDYFKTADWYDDSSRKIELKPDGVKKNKFEFFEYAWEKEGRTLRVGFEKTGRRINLVETDDYLVEFTAENHELAFGLSYNCRFRVVNKSGAELNVAIAGRNDSTISFNDSWAASVSDEAVFEGMFFVNAISEAQDPWRMHPCVLADITVNGRSAEFGLGIEPKFPVSVSLERKNHIAKPGTTEDVYINIKNDLPRDATVKFALPENPLTRFDQTQFDVRLTHGKDTMLIVGASLLGCGYASLPIAYKITLESGDTIEATRPLHIINQGISGQFGFESNDCYGAANGLWRVRLAKKDNTVNFDRLVPSGHGEFPVSKLGKPYDDEFNIVKPSDVRVTDNGSFIRFEADFTSQVFSGAVLTEAYEFDATGVLKLSHKVENIGEASLDLSVQSPFWTNIGRRAVYHYDGGFHGVDDNMIYGFSTLDMQKIDENWIFEACEDNPTGVCWPPQYKPDFKWSDVIDFEFSTGELKPGQIFETEPIFYMCGVFKECKDFRDYALGSFEEKMPFVRNHIEVLANGGNPVLSENSLPLSVRNNRQHIRKGTITVSSADGLFAEQKQENPADELRPENVFLVPVAPGNAGIGLVDFSLKVSGFEKDVRRALLITDDSEIQTEERGGILTATNGKLRFSVSPDYSDALYSLRFGDNEWFYSRYPSHDPYSWWNPFIGGIKTFLERMGNSLVLREKITASFTSQTDSLGNVWTGIRADVAVEKFDEYKNMRYTQYYLTLPGVPVMCHFLRLENNAGRYLDAELFTMLNLSGKDGISNMFASTSTRDNTDYFLRFCEEGHEMYFDRLVTFSYDGEKARSEKLYVFKDSDRDRGKHTVENDMNIVFCDYNMKGRVPDGGRHATKPIFCILTDKELTLESLTDLERITF